MPNRLSFTSIKISFFILGLFALPSSAFAGFQWVQPQDAPAPAPVVLPAPSQTVQTYATSNPEIISPVIITGNSPSMQQPMASSGPVVLSPASGTLMPPTPSSNINSGLNQVAGPSSVPTVSGREEPIVTNLPPLMPHAPNDMGMVSAPQGTTTLTPSAEVVRGFAKQVPLAVALRQILPPGYGFSVDPDVDLGVLISFQGGKPWRDTLKDALEPAGLAMHEDGQMVTVGRAENMVISTSLVAPHAMAPSQPVDMPATEAMSMAPTNEPVVEKWQASRGDSLHKIVQAWSERANVELNWLAEYDYPLQASVSFSGTYEDAVRNLLTGFQEASPQPIAKLHLNPALGQKVMIVETRGNNYSD